MMRNPYSMLQQYLPFTVLKLDINALDGITIYCALQQYLPFTVLKLVMRNQCQKVLLSCNSTYRLRY